MLGPRNPEEAEVYAVEELLADTQYCIQSVMGRKNVSRSELAKRLGCSPANVTQMLSEDSNLTLESIARIFHALEDRMMVKSEYLENRQAWVRADPTHGKWDWTPKFAQATFEHATFEHATFAHATFIHVPMGGIGSEAVPSDFGFWQEWHIQAGEPDSVLEGEESLHGIEQAA